MRSILSIPVILALSACAPQTVVLPGVMPHEERVRLEGEWFGTYLADSADAQRGRIVFLLEVEERVAHGLVVMAPTDKDEFQRYQPGPGRTARAPVKVVGIRFIHVSGTEVEGVLDPYWDENERCIATATFYGRIDGDEIAGTFVVRYKTTTRRTSGTWSVRRIRDSGLLPLNRDAFRTGQNAPCNGRQRHRPREGRTVWVRPSRHADSSAAAGRRV